MADVLEAELAGFFLERCDEALVEADGGVTFAADDVVVVVIGLFGKIESFSFEGDSLEEACLAEGFEDSVDGGAVAGGGADLGVDLLGGEGGAGFFKEAEDSPAAGGGLEASSAERICSFGGGVRVAVGHG